MSTFSSTIDANDLRNQFRGVLVEPGDSRWDAARQAYNLTFDQEPLLIAFPVDSADVQVLVRTRAERGIEVAPQRTGHNAEPLGVAGRHDPGQDRRACSGVEIDAERRVARVRSGAKWADVVAARRPTWASPRCTARRRTSASPATRSAAASAGTPASTALSDEQRARDRARHRRRPVPARRRRPRRRSCSGRCAAAAATSASSPRSRSSCTRSPRSTPACCSSRGSARPRCSTRGASGRRPCPTR